MAVIPIALATEDELSEAIALRLIGELKKPHYISHKLRRGGAGYLYKKMGSWYQMAQYQIMLILTDLDHAKCPVEYREKWLSQKSVPANLVFRIAVREVESWVLADHQGMRELIGNKGVLPREPDILDDPKQTFLELAKVASKNIRDDLIKNVNGHLRPGLGYNFQLTRWIKSSWSPERASERSPSLARARKRLREAVKLFVKA